MQTFGFRRDGRHIDTRATDIDILPVHDKSPADHNPARCPKPANYPAAGRRLVINCGLVFWWNLQARFAANSFLLFPEIPLFRPCGNPTYSLYYSSWNLASTSSLRASIAFFASGPAASISISVPVDAASIISPMIDTPETSVPRLRTMIRDSNSPASLTNFAAAPRVQSTLIAYCYDPLFRLRHICPALVPTLNPRRQAFKRSGPSPIARPSVLVVYFLAA